MKHALVIVALLVSVNLDGSQPDAARLLAGMRQAIDPGGSLASLQTFSVDGIETRTIAGQELSVNVEFACELPDRCIKVRRIDVPFRGQTIETDGFNGDARIVQRAANIPYPPDPFANESPDQQAARALRAVQSMKHEYARVLIPLLGVPPFDPVDVIYEGQQNVEYAKADVLLLRGQDGYEARLFLDPVSHLPALISWMGKPQVDFVTSSTEVVRNGQVVQSSPPSPPFPVGDPSAGAPMVEHRIFYAQYRVQDGLNLPRAVGENVGRKGVWGIRFNKVKINPKLDPGRFTPSK